MTLARIDVVVILALAAVLVPRTALADDLPAPRLVPELQPGRDQAQDSAPRTDTWSRTRSVSVQGGSGGGPLGYGGLSFEYAPSKYFVTGAGAGISPNGVTGALWPRLRFPVTRWLAPGIGLPFSAGPYEYVAQAKDQCAVAGCGTGYRTERSWPIAFWGHLEPNLEIRFPGGVAMRLFAGYSSVLNGRDDRCTSTLPGGCPSSLGEHKWYGGFALGYAF